MIKFRVIGDFLSADTLRQFMRSDSPPPAYPVSQSQFSSTNQSYPGLAPGNTMSKGNQDDTYGNELQQLQVSPSLAVGKSDDIFRSIFDTSTEFLTRSCYFAQISLQSIFNTQISFFHFISCSCKSSPLWPIFGPCDMSRLW